MMETILELNKITVSSKEGTVLNEITMKLQRGRIYGLVSANGGGKTTLMKVMLRQLAVSHGEIIYPSDISVGYSIANDLLFGNLTAQQNLSYYARISGKNLSRIDDLLKTVGLYGEKKPAKKFSDGMKQRLSLAIAFVNIPDLLILDEALSAIDASSREALIQLLNGLVSEYNTTMIAADHNSGELFGLCDTFFFLEKGVLIEELSREQLLSRCSGSQKQAERYLVDFTLGSS